MGNLVEAIKTNLIAGGAYQQIAKAFFVTIFIVILSWIVAFVVGTLCSYFFCYETKIITKLCAGISFLFRSTPVLLLLLLFYYGFLGTLHFPGLLLCGLAIGFYGSGHFSELIMKTLKESDDFQNPEMRRRLRTNFLSAALPHASLQSLFSIKRLCIQLLQWSTVVGYIGVKDLVETMLTIGHRNMAPFFGIVFSILIYLVATVGIELGFSWIEKKMSH